MAPDTRILNLTRGFRLKRNQALRAIEECACTWATDAQCDEANVPRRSAIRDLTLAESIAARNQQAREREPLESPELPGLTFQPPSSAVSSSPLRRRLIQAANQFVAQNA